MSMLYKALRWGLSWGLDVYFVDIQSIGEEHVPEQGPVIFAANHPNSIMDTVILGTRTPRQIHYMARSGLFKNPIVATIFDRCGVIPIFRAQDQGDMTQNQSSFSRAFEVLEQGLCLGIFPEGQNSEERHIKDIKTGTARIALGAEALHDYQLGVKVVPVGLNFQDRDQFLTGVLIRFGEPIDAKEFAKLHKEDQRKATRAMTDKIQESLRQAATHIEHEVVHQLLSKVQMIAGKELLYDLAKDKAFASFFPEPGEEDELHVSAYYKELLHLWKSTRGKIPALDEEFRVERFMANAFEYAFKHEPENLELLRREVFRYEDHLRQVRLLRDFGQKDPVALSSSKDAVRLTSYALVFGVFAGWGLVHNIIPYKTTTWLARKAFDEAIRAITGFFVGVLLFPLFYSILAFLLWSVVRFEPSVIVFYILTLPPSGFFFLRYRRQIAEYRARILTRTFFRTQRNLVRTLLDERAALMEHVLEVFKHFAHTTAHTSAHTMARTTAHTTVHHGSCLEEE